MPSTDARKQLATVDVTTLNSLRWGPIRQMFPAFVEEIELGRYLKKLLRTAACRAVQIQPHVQTDGTPSPHVFDVFLVDDAR